MKFSIATLTLAAFATHAKANVSEGRPSSLGQEELAVAENIIHPLQGDAKIPKNSIAFELVFERALDFEYMTVNSNAAAQVFKYLPIAVATGLGIDKEQVVVTELHPFDLPVQYDYLATAAVVWVPRETCGELLEQFRTPNSPIFVENSGAAAALVRLVNPSMSSFYRLSSRN